LLAYTSYGIDNNFNVFDFKNNQVGKALYPELSIFLIGSRIMEGMPGEFFETFFYLFNKLIP